MSISSSLTSIPSSVILTYTTATTAAATTPSPSTATPTTRTIRMPPTTTVSAASSATASDVDSNPSPQANTTLSTYVHPQQRNRSLPKLSSLLHQKGWKKQQQHHARRSGRCPTTVVASAVGTHNHGGAAMIDTPVTTLELTQAMDTLPHDCCLTAKTTSYPANHLVDAKCSFADRFGATAPAPMPMEALPVVVTPLTPLPGSTILWMGSRSVMFPHLVTALNIMLCMPYYAPDATPMIQTPHLGSFFSQSLPGIPLPEYFKRLMTYFDCSPTVFPVALTYMMRVSSKFEGLMPSSPAGCGASRAVAGAVRHLNRFERRKSAAAKDGETMPLIHPLCGHRLLLTCCVMAAKYVDDQFYNTQYYAATGGMTTAELSQLEWHLFEILDYDAYVDEECMQQVVSTLMGLPIPSATLTRPSAATIHSLSAQQQQ